LREKTDRNVCAIQAKPRGMSSRHSIPAGDPKIKNTGQVIVVS